MERESCQYFRPACANSFEEPDEASARTRADGLDSNCLWSLLVRRWDLFALVQGGVEQSVDQCRLAETRLSDDHSSKVESLSDTLSVYLVGQVGETDIAGELLASSSNGGCGTVVVCLCRSIHFVSRRSAVHDDDVLPVYECLFWDTGGQWMVAASK